MDISKNMEERSNATLLGPDKKRSTSFAHVALKPECLHHEVRLKKFKRSEQNDFEEEYHLDTRTQISQCHTRSTL